MGQTPGGQTPGRAVDIRQTDGGFVVTVDGVHKQACDDMAAVVAFVNTVLPPGRQRPALPPAPVATDDDA